MLVLYCLTADGGAVPSCFHAVVHEAARPARWLNGTEPKFPRTLASALLHGRLAVAR